MTNYNPNEPYGGKAFQRLMLLLLGHGWDHSVGDKIPGRGKNTIAKGGGNHNPMHFEYMWDAETQSYGPMFLKDKPADDAWHAIAANHQLMMIDNPYTGIVSSGPHLSETSRPTACSTAPPASYLGAQGRMYGHRLVGCRLRGSRFAWAAAAHHPCEMPPGMVPTRSGRATVLSR